MRMSSFRVSAMLREGDRYQIPNDRVQRVRKAVTIPGNARLDTDIIIDLMNRMGYPQPASYFC